MNNHLLETLVLLAPLLLAATLVRVNPLPIRTFQAVYLLFGAAWIGIHTYFFEYYGVIAPILCLLIGEVILFLAMGLIGTKLGAANYASILIGVGLFPWHVGLIPSTIYVMTALLVSSLVAWFKFKVAARGYSIRGNMRVDAIRGALSEEDFEKFANRASAIFSLPIAFSAFVVLALAS